MRKLVTFISPSVTDLTADAISPSTVRLDWVLPVDSKAVDYYKIYRDGVLIGTSTTTTYDDTTATAVHNYTYGVISVVNYRVESAIVTVVNHAIVPTVPVLTVTVISGTQINLSWTVATVSGGTVVAYKLRRDGVIINGSANALSYINTGLTQNTNYSYTISSVDDIGNESAQSLPKTAKTFDAAPPTVPTGLTATVVSTTQINLKWNASSDNVGVTGYKLYRGATLINGSGSALFYNDTGLTPGTAYSYTVSAFDARNNTSAASAAVVATTDNLIVGKDYTMGAGGLSLTSLKNYLGRSMVLARIGEGVWGNYADDLRMIQNAKPKYLERVLLPFANENLWAGWFTHAKTVIDDIHNIDPDIICGGGLFEYATTLVNNIAIPPYVFTAFGETPVTRNFVHANIVEVTNPIYPTLVSKIPNIVKPEAQKWYYYIGTQQILAGIEGFNCGVIDAITYYDRPLGWINYFKVLGMLRDYAATYARRKWILCGAGGSYIITRGGKLCFDYGGANMHAHGIREVAGVPYNCTLGTGTSGWANSGTGITPSGWTATNRLPYTVSIDNGSSPNPGVAGVNNSWGWDEISWFTNCSNSYRNYWLPYAYNYAKSLWGGGVAFCSMPGKRVINPYIGATQFYCCNTSTNNTLGFNQEETIKALWAAQP